MYLTSYARRWPVACYFTMVYLLSAAALAVIGLPRLHGGTGHPVTSLIMFPVMVVGVGVIGVLLTRLITGVQGLERLVGQFRRPVPRRWLAVLLIPPTGILTVLAALSLGISSAYTPQFFVFGIAAGAVSGFFEEIGWTGFAYPRMRDRFGWLPAAVLLGVLWGLWHLQVVDSMGAASPHGPWWPGFFAAFIAVVAAVRVLIAWVYNHTGSLRLAQLLHASSTGFLVILGAPRVTPAQEVLWYFIYAGLLWAAVTIVVTLQRNQERQPAQRPATAGTTR